MLMCVPTHETTNTIEEKDLCLTVLPWAYRKKKNLREENSFLPFYSSDVF